MAESGTMPRRAIAVGGGTASRLWLQIVSDVTGMTQEIPDRLIGAAYGDAYLAAAAIGLPDEASGRDEPWVHTVDRIEPNLCHESMYAERYGLYRELYKVTRPIVHALARGIPGDGLS
jgi:xylulokinase